MIDSLTRLTSADLIAMARIRRRIERYDKELVAIYAHAKTRRRPSAFGQKSTACVPRQPSLRTLISGILRKGTRPMSVQAIYEATLLSGYRWRSRKPLNNLKGKLYTDPTFKKVSPNHFVLRSTRPTAAASR